MHAPDKRGWISQSNLRQSWEGNERIRSGCFAISFDENRVQHNERSM